MLKKKLKEIYSVDTISQNKSWEKVEEQLKQFDGQELELDMTGVNVIDPWNCDSFKNIIKNDNLYLKFTNAEDTANKIKMIYVLQGLDHRHVINEVIETEAEKTPEEIKIETFGKALMPYFKKDEQTGIVTFVVADKFSQLHNTLTANYVKYVVGEMSREQGDAHFIIDLGKLSILDNVIEAFVEAITYYEKLGITIEVNTDIPDTQKQFKLFLYKSKAKNYTEAERLQEFKKLKPGTAGILIKYKKSRALDEFGRHGKGEVVSSRIARFLGITNSKRGPMFSVETYNQNTFYTHLNWALEHDMEQPTELKSDKLDIALEQIGFDNKFMGSSYHFLFPVQRDKSESINVIVDIDENGYNIKKLMTIPERMKEVFDDWEIEYDHESLDKFIEQTKEKLAQAEKEEEQGEDKETQTEMGQVALDNEGQADLNKNGQV